MPTNHQIFDEAESQDTSWPHGAKLRAAVAKTQVPIELVLSSDARVPLSGEIPLSAKVPLQFLLSIRKGDLSSSGVDVAVVEEDEEQSMFEGTHTHSGRHEADSWLVVRPVKSAETSRRTRATPQTPRSPLWQYLTRDQELKEQSVYASVAIEKRQVALEGSFAALEEEVDRLRRSLDDIVRQPTPKPLSNAACSILHDIGLIQVQVQDMHEVNAKTVAGKLRSLGVAITRATEKIEKWGPASAQQWLGRAVELHPFDTWEKQPDSSYTDQLHTELNCRIAYLHQVAALVVAHNPQGDGVTDWPPSTPGATPGVREADVALAKGASEKKSKA